MVSIPQSCLLERGDAREALYHAQHSPLHLLHVCRPQAAGLASSHVWAHLSTRFCFCPGAQESLKEALLASWSNPSQSAEETR